MSKLAFLLLVLYLQSNVSSISAKYLSCPAGWVTYRGSSYCYRAGNKPTNRWNDARKACLAMGGDLVKIRSAQENRYVSLLARTYSSSSSLMWLGLVGDSNNRFAWVDGSDSSTQYSNWRPNEPNNYNGQAEDCAIILLSIMKWDDVLCYYRRALIYYICEREKQY